MNISNNQFLRSIEEGWQLGEETLSLWVTLWWTPVTQGRALLSSLQMRERPRSGNFCSCRKMSCQLSYAGAPSLWWNRGNQQDIWKDARIAFAQVSGKISSFIDFCVILFVTGDPSEVLWPPAVEVVLEKKLSTPSSVLSFVSPPVSPSDRWKMLHEEIFIFPMKGQVWRNLPNFMWVWLVWCPPVCTPAEFRSGEVVDVGCDMVWRLRWYGGLTG